MVEQCKKRFLHDILTILDRQQIEPQDVAQQTAAKRVKQLQNFRLHRRKLASRRFSLASRIGQDPLHLIFYILPTGLCVHSFFVLQKP